MNRFAIFLLLLLAVTVNGCLKTRSNCACGDFFDLVLDEGNIYLYTRGPGCVANLTCEKGFYTQARSRWELSEIPRPANAYVDRFFAVIEHRERGYVNILDFLGIICEDGKWKTTQYPYNIFTSKNDHTNPYIYEPEDLYGLKSEIVSVTCENTKKFTNPPPVR